MSDYLPGFTPTDPACIIYAPFAWVELAPGETWKRLVTLEGCGNDNLGTFLFYGHREQGNKTNTIRQGDGLHLEARNTETGEIFVDTNPDTKDEVRVSVMVVSPVVVEVSMRNDSNKDQHVRATWLRA